MDGTKGSTRAAQQHPLMDFGQDPTDNAAATGIVSTNINYAAYDAHSAHHPIGFSTATAQVPERDLTDSPQDPTGIATA